MEASPALLSAEMLLILHQHRGVLNIAVFSHRWQRQGRTLTTQQWLNTRVKGRIINLLCILFLLWKIANLAETRLVRSAWKDERLHYLRFLRITKMLWIFKRLKLLSLSWRTITSEKMAWLKFLDYKLIMLIFLVLKNRPAALPNLVMSNN